MAKKKTPTRSPARISSAQPAIGDNPLSARLRQARIAQSLGLKDVAERTGLSIGFISQVERGLTTPSMRSLRQFADALGLAVDELFSEPPPVNGQEALHVVRKHLRRVLDLDDIGMHMEIMTPKRSPGIQAFAAYMRPGGTSGREFDTHEGQECGVIIDGQLELWLDKEKYVLGPGDCFSFNSRKPHRYRNPGPTMTYIHWVITPPIY